MSFSPLAIHLGSPQAEQRLRIEVLDYEHPEMAEPANLDLLRCGVAAQAGPVAATFDLALGLWELLEVREYLQRIGSGNGPSQSFALAGGLLSLSFAPSRRGPVLCAVLLKSIDASHLRLEFLITLEPAEIARALFDLGQLAALTSR